MTSRDTGRRAFLFGALALPLAACAHTDVKPTTPPGIDTAAANARFATLEQKYGARLGVYALATDASVGYRAGERFAFCSTFKTLAAAAVLDRFPLSHLDTVVPITKADVNSISPDTRQRIGQGMTIRQLCDAAIRDSDGTAGNLLMRDIGGPTQLTAYLRRLGDTVSRMDSYEPELNRGAPGDDRDTTTPEAIAADYQRIVLGDALPPDKRSPVLDWLRRSTTGGNTIRAGVPAGWTVANKTGHGDYRRENDVGIAWPPDGEPLVLAIFSDRAGYDTSPQPALIAEAAAYLAGVLP